MSTRTQIMVRENEKCKIYKHSDGYPEGVLDVLLPTVTMFQEHRGWDSEYLTARILMAFAVDEHERYKEYQAEYEKDPEGPYSFVKYFGGQMKVTGFGLDPDWHGDIEFAYVIEPDFTINVHCFWGCSRRTPTKSNLMCAIPSGTSLEKALADCKAAVEAYDE